ncbi:MAG: UDP-N-acetylmuramate--L-alanine ligase [Candidatus Wallbacteria bacterium HGW-Wallbacteria-1]|jgi:UDP-N-acetylmuramate--alanine ligase|uniref:UDP-N-acetylmuramate--L-alanine ligase n=1 Tax=Candidatus Wallbacteria bacterium HGW-Wallbacteria-1 TaxID=2013854 RepID=A0A2N1PUM7_9BACT|nr:MAG: UDP-N-acetylmuramate--L-alanine ligase [Candidatus Wallbacteria bacterium HGW-Wallbacteria-1]
MFLKIKRIHFIGIGGIGMSGLAELLHNQGFQVTGSDVSEGYQVRQLMESGIRVTVPHDPAIVEGADVVVTSSAIPAENPEVRAAEANRIPVIPRAEMLAELMKMKYGVAIAGAHGKTTTSSITGMILTEGGLDPTLVIGGVLENMGSNTKLGLGDFLVAEADESDGSFLLLSPTIAVVTGIDMEHLDFYQDMEQIKKDFLFFINKVPFYGTSIICMDDDHLVSLLPQIRRNVITYGLSSQADVTARNLVLDGMATHFDLYYKGDAMGSFTINIPGRHMVSNALASIAVALELSIDPQKVRTGLAGFTGVKRRFELKGREAEIPVYDDYAHHPTEIRATLSMMRERFNGRIIVLFQPHRYSRSAHLMEDFGRAFFDADTVIVTDIYPAGERALEGVNGEVMAATMGRYGHKGSCHVPSLEDGAQRAAQEARPGDVIITMGAGSITRAGQMIIEAIRTK